MNADKRLLKHMKDFLRAWNCMGMVLVFLMAIPANTFCREAPSTAPQNLEIIRSGRHRDHIAVVFEFAKPFQLQKPVLEQNAVRFRLRRVLTELKAYREYKHTEAWVRLKSRGEDLDVRVGLQRGVSRFGYSILEHPDRLAVYLYRDKSPRKPPLHEKREGVAHRVKSAPGGVKERLSEAVVPEKGPVPAGKAGTKGGNGTTQGRSPESAEKGQPVTVQGPENRLLTLNFFQGDIQEILSGLAIQQKVNIVTSKDVSGKISVHLYQVPFERALHAICKAGGFAYLKRGDIYYVFKPEKPPEPQGERLEMRVFKLEYADLNKVQDVLSAIPGIRMVKLHEPSRTIVVEDTPENIAKIEAIIHFWDSPPRQVMIEAKILEILLTDDMNLGVNWERVLGDVRIGTGGFSRAILPSANAVSPVPSGEEGLFANILTAAGTRHQFAAALDALRSKTKINTLSTPKVMALNGKLAKVQVGGKQGYTVTTVNQGISTESIEFIDTGTILEITPHIDHENNILLELKPSLNSATIEEGIPVVRSTNVTTWVMARNGETVFIGGLIEDKSIEDRAGVPCLMNIPGLNMLFGTASKSNEKSELVVLITPHIVDFRTPGSREAIKKAEEAKKYFESKSSSPSTLLNPLNPVK